MPKSPSLEDMLKAGVHFGHQTSRWHPKMSPFIFGQRSNIHIIDLEQTQERLEKALDFLKGVASRGGTVLFVGTKSQAKPVVSEQATAAEMPYVTERWLGGTLTNFQEIQKLVKTFVNLKDQKEKGELKKYTKKEQLWFERDIEEMDRKVGGIQTMTKVPDALFIVDVRTEKTALLEAIHRGIPVVALVDTNVNPRGVTYPIPANDDGVKSIELMVRLVSEAVQEGKKNPVAPAAKDEKSSEGEMPVKKESKETVADLSDKIAENVADEKVKEKVKS